MVPVTTTTTVVKEVVKEKAAEHKDTQVSKASVESPQTIIENKAKQSNTATQTGDNTVTTGKKSDWDGAVEVDQNQDQSNSVDTYVDNTNVNINKSYSNVNKESGNTIDSGNNIIEVEDNLIVLGGLR